MKRDFFSPTTFKSCLHSFTEGFTLHDHLIPSPILLAAHFLTAQKIHPNSITSLSIPSCSTQNTTESTIHEFQPCPALSLCNFSCISGIGALKGFLMSLPTSQGSHSSESSSSKALLEKKNLLYLSTYP